MTKNQQTLITRIILFAGTGISLFFVPWLLVKAWILPIPDTLQGQLDQAIDHGFEGMLVYVDQGGKTPQSLAAGWHNRESETPARPDALFKLASISKLYVAVAITKLVSEGKLSLDETIVDYLPELAGRIEYADQITLKMMIQHRSGIPNYTDAPDFWASPEKSYDENLALILDKPALFKPDEDYAYCNTNYLLLDRIMNNTLGYSYFDYVKEKVLDPLNLTQTYSSVNVAPMDQVMSGYHQGYPHDLKADDLGIVATAKDTGIFLRALNDGSLFENGEKDIYSSIYEYEHDGWVPGYQSFAHYYPEIDAVVISFYSTTDPKLYLWNLSQIINGRIVKILEREG